MKIPFDRTRLEQILNKIKDLRIGVVGDFILDGYWYADMEQSQLSRETATFPRPITRETYSLGGAANVAWNLSALGVAGVWGFSVIGDDWRGNILRSLLVKANVQTSGIFNQVNRQTPFYGKVMLTAVGRRLQEDARLDFINDQPISPEMEVVLLDALNAFLDYCGLSTYRHIICQGYRWDSQISQITTKKAVCCGFARAGGRISSAYLEAK